METPRASTTALLTSMDGCILQKLLLVLLSVGQVNEGHESFYKGLVYVVGVHEVHLGLLPFNFQIGVECPIAR